MVGHVEVADERGHRIPVLVRGPFEFRGVGVPGADVLGLQMLQLTVNVVSFAHFYPSALFSAAECC